jgi:hypothetical protein
VDEGFITYNRGSVDDQQEVVRSRQVERVMALFLIYGKNNTHADPAKDARGCYKLGDIVQVLDDSHPIASPISSEWYIVRITDVTKAQVLHFMEPYIDPATAGTALPVTLRRRKFNVEVATLPLAFRQKMAKDRYAEVTLSQVRNYVRNRMTGGTA